MERSARILVVDDSRLQRGLLVGLLERRGYEVVEAESGQGAIDAMRAESPDAVLLDWELPDFDGPEVLRRWQQSDQARWVPVLMVTSHDSPERIRQALDLGATDYLRKPPGSIELDARLRSALRIRALHQELLTLATRDALTGLFNRRVLMDRLGAELARGSRYRRPLAVAILDIDFFKKVNDTHGHDVGDVVLAQMAELLLDGTRAVDTVARMGGEEFVVVFPETQLEGARLCLERLRERAAAMAWGPEGATFSVTFSAGMADLASTPERSSSRILKAADEALYRAKQLGRNRVEVTLKALPDVANG